MPLAFSSVSQSKQPGLPTIFEHEVLTTPVSPKLFSSNKANSPKKPDVPTRTDIKNLFAASGEQTEVIGSTSVALVVTGFVYRELQLEYLTPHRHFFKIFGTSLVTGVFFGYFASYPIRIGFRILIGRVVRAFENQTPTPEDRLIRWVVFRLKSAYDAAE